MSKIVAHALFVAGIILICFSGFYIFQIVRLDLWEDVIFRIVSVMSFIGGGVFVGLSAIIKNQQKLIATAAKFINNKKET